MKFTIKIINYNFFNNLISSYNWQNVIIDNDVDMLVDTFNHKKH